MSELLTLCRECVNRELKAEAAMSGSTARTALYVSLLEYVGGILDGLKDALDSTSDQVWTAAVYESELITVAKVLACKDARIAEAVGDD